VVPLAEEVQVRLSQHGLEAIGVFQDLVPTLPGHAQPVGHASLGGDGPGEEPLGVDALELPEAAAVLGDDGHGGGAGQEGAHDEARSLLVHPEVGERVRVVARYDGCPDFRVRLFLPHDGSSPVRSSRRPRMPLTGMPTQSGRLSNSYRISYRAFSSVKSSISAPACSSFSG
jgi:hypothetical protein